MLDERSPNKELPHLAVLERAARERVKMNQETAATIQPNPQRGKGDKDQECSHYRRCLDLAAMNDWPSFHCEECEYALTGGPPIEDVDADRNETEEEAPDDLKPTKGEGDQCTDCTWLDECYQYAANKGWPDFHCGGCPYNPEAEEDAPESPENEQRGEEDGDGCDLTDEAEETAPTLEENSATRENHQTASPPNDRICEECGIKTTITPKSPLCAACMGRKGGTGAPKKSKVSDGGSGSHNSPSEAASAPTMGQKGQGKPLAYASLEYEPSLPPGGAPQISFQDRPEVWDALLKVAHREVRPVGNQIIYYVEKALRAEGLLSGE
jgi:hypothetical protein